MSFAALETRLASAVTTALANATLSWVGGNSADGMFDNPYNDALGMASNSPTFACLESAVSALPVETAVTVTRLGVVTSFSVAEKQPDGAGLTVLVLR